MNCQNFESVVDELARDQIMEAAIRGQAMAHSASCEACSLRLREERGLTEGLREMASMMEQEVASNTIETKLAVEFRNYHGAKRGSAVAGVIPTGFGRSNRRYWSYAAAAGVVIAVALGVAANRFWRSEVSSGERGSGEIVQATKPDPNTTEPVSAPAGTQAPPSASMKRVVQRNSKRASIRSAAFRSGVAKNTVTVQSLTIIDPAAEVTTDFIPIAYSNLANIQEGGQVMRLELPRYAMARFGVPINEERYDERVKADVWVGADGLARAIRFVQ
jgi:hypothetical protein